MEFLPDSPVTADALGFETFIAHVVGAVTRATPPYVFGVLGDWGTGKTSILNMLEAQIPEVSEATVTIRFDAWRYENETSIIYPLLHAIEQAHTKLTGSSDGNGFGAKLKNVAGTAFLATADGLLRLASKTLIGDAIKIEDLDKHFELIKKHRDKVVDVLAGWTDQVEALRAGFESLLEEFAKDVARSKRISPNDVRFVILIDDLDRCLPDTTIRLLESIKNHLEVSRAVFVLALNAAVVYQGIRHKYGSVDVNGREYLEKILNFSFYVPEPDPERLVKFVDSRFDEIRNDLTYTQHRWLVDSGRTLRDCKFTNPRKIKRVLNRFVMFVERPDAELTKYRAGAMARLFMLAEYFPDVFQLVRDFVRDQNGRELPFSPAQFEKHYQAQMGMTLVARYPQISVMRELYTLNETQFSGELNSLRKHVDEVYQLTRLV